VVPYNLVIMIHLLIRQSSFFAVMIMAPLLRTTHSYGVRVAVLGSGIAGSTAARTLADKDIEVTVFEAGFGIGGRTSTRKTRDTFRYQFDHGAQYIGTPKSAIFRDTLDQWRSDNWVQEWSGCFLTVDGSQVKQEQENERKDRFVGFPAMHSICRNLLHHEKIRLKLQTRANASRNEKGEWELVHDKTNKCLGTFDWLIVSDRNSASHYRQDLASVDIEKFTSGSRKIKSVKCLTAMVVFEKPLNFDMDGIQFTGNDPKFGSLGWAARDSSKPGRERTDGKECWVLQTHPDAAKELMKGKNNVKEIRELAKDVLVHDFLKSVPYLSGSEGNEVKIVDLPKVVSATGHRCSGAFPIPTEEFLQIESQMIASKNFVACGDYFGPLSGRIEGAYLSGISSANQLYNRIQLVD